MEIPACALIDLPRTIEKHPELRVHIQHFKLGNLKQAAVEQQFVLVTKQTFVGTGQSACAGFRAYRLIAFAVPFADRFLNNLPLAEQIPEIVVCSQSSGQTVTVSGNREWRFKFDG